MVAARQQLHTLKRVTPRTIRLSIAAALVLVVAPFAFAQLSRSSPPRTTARPAGTPTPVQPMKKASELINRQPPIVVNKSIYDSLTSEQAHVIVNLTKQRA